MLRQWLNRLEFVVHVDGSNLFPHRGEDAVIDDARRDRPFRIEWATRESGFGRLFLIVGNLSGSQNTVHENNNRSLQSIVKAHHGNDWSPEESVRVMPFYCGK